LQQTGSATQSGASGCIEVFAYPDGPDAPSLPSWDAWAAGSADSVPGKPAGDHAQGAKDAGVRAEFEQRLATETRRSFEAGREQGRMEGRQAEREDQPAAQAAAHERRARQAAELIESFAEERDRYLQAVEHEVVELALAVTARILRREAQMDPLLLTGAVRVALGQLSGSTQVRLRVPPAELDLWTETIALLPKLRVKPTVVSGEGMRLGDCMMETELGSVDLGIRAQLGEIERGFFDRAGGRSAGPGAGTDEAPGVGREARP
jgi:flagellar assembly protein FliH